MSYDHTNFLAFYPQFTGNINTSIVDQFCTMALAIILPTRYHEDWSFAMALLVAHYSVLYMKELGPASPTPAQVIAAAQPAGLQTSKGIGDLSVTYDFSAVTEATKQWGDWNATSYGQRLIRLATVRSKAGIYVY